MNIFNWVHQRPEQNLTESELVLPIHFSENYACKMRTEAQAYYFEGSPKKVTIHTEAFTQSIGRHYPLDEQAVWYTWSKLKLWATWPQMTFLRVISNGPVTKYRTEAII